MSIRVGEAADAPAFAVAAKQLMTDEQLRRNVRNATEIIRNKRANVVAEMPDWQELRDAAHAIKDHTLRHLGEYLGSSKRTAFARAEKCTGLAMRMKRTPSPSASSSRTRKGSHQSQDDDDR